MPTPTEPLAPWSQSLAPWSEPKKMAFRFCLLYFATYIFFTPNNDLPIVNTLYEGINHLLHRFIPWFAQHIYGYRKPITIFTNGSGDTTYDYMLWFFGITLTLAGAITWTLLDRKRKKYQALYYWIRVLLRYYLFYTMISYGFFKVIKVQFPFPSLYRLVQPYGNSSPMGLEWTQMGYSTIYNYFAGFAELLGGLLLLSRRTTTIGALVCLAVMTNVFMINMGFDVPVKLLSFNTILMCLFLLGKDILRLTNFFILNKAVPPSDLSFPHFNKKLRYGLLGVKLLFVASLTWLTVSNAWDTHERYGANAPKAPLYGIYYPEAFIRNNVPVPPLQTDTTRWNRLIVAAKDYASIRLMNDSTLNYHFEIDTLTKTAVLYPFSDTLNKSRFNYLKDSLYLTLTGKIGGDSVFIKLKRFDENRFRLVSRGFHWVNEYPYNR
jgi:uncharacterized membrane protein YphA (DoxX/SURF4 family)